MTVLQSTKVGHDSVRRNLNINDSSEYLEMIAEIVPSSHITVIEDTGHFIQIEQPQAVVSAIIDS